MPRQGTFPPYLAIAVAVAVSLNVDVGAQSLRKTVHIGVPGIPVQQTDMSALLGPMPRLDPIDRFVPPIDPWKPGGFGWDVEGLDDEGDPLCVTNRRPTPACDPDGPRAFLHAGFDAAPAPDRVVRASAAGRVVIARPPPNRRRARHVPAQLPGLRPRGQTVPDARLQGHHQAHRAEWALHISLPGLPEVRAQESYSIRRSASGGRKAGSKRSFAVGFALKL